MLHLFIFYLCGFYFSFFLRAFVQRSPNIISEKFFDMIFKFDFRQHLSSKIVDVKH